MKTYYHNEYKYWWDFTIRFWTVVKLDAAGNQEGNAEYYGNKWQLLTSYPQFKFSTHK